LFVEAKSERILNCLEKYSTLTNMME
jgi:hypothetical protein